MTQVIDSDDEGAVVFDSGSQHSGGLFQTISHKDKPKGEFIPDWALARPVQPLGEESCAPESQEEVLADAAWNWNPSPVHGQRTESQQQAEAEFDAFGNSSKRKLDLDKADGYNTPSPPRKAQVIELERGDDAIKDSEANNDGKIGGPSKAESELAELLKSKALSLKDDPKFAKGTSMNSLTPSSKKVLKEIRKIRARENSTEWHKQWVSKGKARDATDSGGEGAESEQGGEAQDAAKDCEAAVATQDDGEAEGAAQPARPLSLNDARVPWKELLLCFICGLAPSVCAFMLLVNYESAMC